MTTKLNIEQEHREFEVWQSSGDADLERAAEDSQYYADRETNCEWHAWLAAKRAAMEKPLPVDLTDAELQDPEYMRGYIAQMWEMIGEMKPAPVSTEPVGIFDVYPGSEDGNDSFIQIKPEYADSTSVSLYRAAPPAAAKESVLPEFLFFVTELEELNDLSPAEVLAGVLLQERQSKPCWPQMRLLSLPADERYEMVKRAAIDAAREAQ